MQKILVPTDYSENSKNAAEYAMALGKFIKAKIIMFHTFHVPLPSSEHALPLNVEELAKENIYKLRNYAAALQSLHEDIVVDYASVPGFAVDEILNYAKDNKFDLIIMGTKGTDSIENVIAGSVVTKVSSQASIPVLVIPEMVRFKQIRKIVLAYDYSEIKNVRSLEPLRNLVSIFKAEAMVVNILKNEKETLIKTGSSNILEGFLAGVKHSFHFPINKNVVEGLNEFVDKTEIEMIAVIPHKHTRFYHFFHRNNVKRIALHPHVPLLVLPS